ncbi:dimethylarginine dimethylaminohydrolase family protein [Mobilicoccus pelagius]|nr:arginine deiminase family protein [Mobilicoccus pelagius]
MVSRRVLMRRPEPGLGEAVVSLIDREPVVFERALATWEALRALLEGAGWEVVVVTPADGDQPCPDGVFVGDAVTSVRGRVLLARSSVESRRPERAAIRRTLAARHVRAVPVRRPGTLEGGDLVLVDDTLYVGVGSRTNRAGFAQVVRRFSPALRVVPVPLHKSVQLDSGVSALPCGTVLGYPPLVDDPSVFAEFVPVPDRTGAQVFSLGDGRVLVSATAPGSAETVASLGYDPLPVDITEFEKREGTIPCLLAPF